MHANECIWGLHSQWDKDLQQLIPTQPSPLSTHFAGLKFGQCTLDSYFTVFLPTRLLTTSPVSPGGEWFEPSPSKFQPPDTRIETGVEESLLTTSIFLRAVTRFLYFIAFLFYFIFVLTFNNSLIEERSLLLLKFKS